MNTNKNLPRVLYFAIQNSQGKIVYTLQCHKKYFFKVAVDIPDNFLTPPSDDTNYSIVWSINDEVIQHDDIPVLLINYPRINSRVCSSHPFLLDSGYSVLRLPPPRLHRRAVDDTRLPAKFTRQILI